MQTADTLHVYYDPLWREGIMADNIKAAFRLSMPLPFMSPPRPAPPLRFNCQNRLLLSSNLSPCKSALA
jgi:hypothetical protein